MESCTSKKRVEPLSPDYVAARSQLEDTLAYHKTRVSSDDFSAGYVEGVLFYDAYRRAKASGDVAQCKMVVDQHDLMSKWAKEELHSQGASDEYKNTGIVEARGYMRALSDAAKARKGIRLK